MPREDPLLITRHCNTNISIFLFAIEIHRYVWKSVESVITLLQIFGALFRLPLFCRVFFARSLQSEHASETSLTTYCVYLCF